MGPANRQTLVKVPELVLLFWIAKVSTTCFGMVVFRYYRRKPGVQASPEAVSPAAGQPDSRENPIPAGPRQPAG